MPNQREGVTVEAGAILVLGVVTTGTPTATGMQPLPMPAAQVQGNAILVKGV